MKKRMIPVLIVLAVLIGLLGVCANAAEAGNRIRADDKNNRFIFISLVQITTFYSKKLASNFVIGIKLPEYSQDSYLYIINKNTKLFLFSYNFSNFEST